MAKKKYKKIPRKKKKQIKKQLNISGRVEQSELVNLANKDYERQKRREAQARRFKKNREYLSSLGIPTDIITKSTSIKETQRRAEAYLSEKRSSDRKIKQAHLYAKKINRLIDAGYSSSDAQKLAGSLWKQKSNADIDKLIQDKKPINSSIRVQGKNYLYIGFAEKVGGFKQYNLSNLSDDELLEKLNERIEDARMNPDSSHGNKFKGIFQFGSFDSKEKAQRRARFWYERGYNLNFEHGDMKLDNNRYDKITISNNFSYREFLEMAYTCTDQMLNWQVEQFIDTLKDFDNANGTGFTKNFK